MCKPGDKPIPFTVNNISYDKDHKSVITTYPVLDEEDNYMYICCEEHMKKMKEEIIEQFKINFFNRDRDFKKYLKENKSKCCIM